ncbi:unnamed protein product [Rangifer tarandus platyrhynchus]|uniref:Uncharacterized protein n=1 Tax=Rangifer tarandus platyrhynchus TaxID=3082113 RepID=A0AC59YAF8_RANTA
MSHGPGIGGHVVGPSKSKVRRLCIWERKPEQHVERGWEASGFYEPRKGQAGTSAPKADSSPSRPFRTVNRSTTEHRHICGSDAGGPRKASSLSTRLCSQTPRACIHSAFVNRGCQRDTPGNSWEEEASGPSSPQPPGAGTQRAGSSKPSNCALPGACGGWYSKQGLDSTASSSQPKGLSCEH